MSARTSWRNASRSTSAPTARMPSPGPITGVSCLLDLHDRFQVQHAGVLGQAEHLEGQLALQPVVVDGLVEGVHGDGHEVLALHHGDVAEVEPDDTPPLDPSELHVEEGGVRPVNEHVEVVVDGDADYRVVHRLL